MAADPASASSAATLTIGAVCKVLGEEFDDISISKIRFLEDQKLIAPARTPGGYRLYSNEDVERLRSILRLQRDEFLPLAVIRDMLSQGHSAPDPPAAAAAGRLRGAAVVRASWRRRPTPSPRSSAS